MLKKEGLFFSYTPGQNSDAFKNYLPAEKMDDWNLSGVFRMNNPFSGNHYPFHFWDKENYKNALINKDFSVSYLETVQRSYYQGQDIFEHIVVHAKK